MRWLCAVLPVQGLGQRPSGGGCRSGVQASREDEAPARVSREGGAEQRWSRGMEAGGPLARPLLGILDVSGGGWSGASPTIRPQLGPPSLLACAVQQRRTAGGSWKGGEVRRSGAEYGA